jgi:hypothetical protein
VNVECARVMPWCACAAFCFATFGPEVRLARADGARVKERDDHVVVWPTFTPAGDGPSRMQPRRPSESDGALFVRAQELEATLRDAAQDLGFQVDIPEGEPEGDRVRDLDILARSRKSVRTVRGTHIAGASAAGESAPRTSEENSADGTWVVSARLEAEGRDAYLLRVLVSPPGGKEVRVRVAQVSGADVAARGLVLMRDLLASSAAAVIVQNALDKGERAPRDPAAAEEPRSPGRAVLAVHGAASGAFSAFAIERSSSSGDPRVLYPLLAIGTGVGIGSALLIADEWNVTTGNAWYVTAGSFWGVVSGIALANGAGLQPFTDRYAWGLAGGGAGLGLATLALLKNKMDEGDAVLTHSGGALGLLAGGAIELIARGNVVDTPQTGVGIGAAVGVVAMGALSTWTRVAPERVLLIDLGTTLGGIGAAALSSPLVFENVTAGKARGFLVATLAGSALGGAAAWYFTRNRVPNAASLSGVRPLGGVIGFSETRSGTTPAYGAGLYGTF